MPACKHLGNTLLCFRRESDSFIMLNLMPETPNHLAHPYNLPPEASAHTAEHQMQAQADKFSTHELSVQRLREQLAGLFATQHFLNPPGVIPPSVICPTSSIPDISSTPYGRATALTRHWSC